jgi:hypothetical protein
MTLISVEYFFSLNPIVLKLELQYYVVYIIV